MFKEPIVLILGAGSSAHLKYPLGWELVEEIRKLLNQKIIIKYDSSDYNFYHDLKENRKIVNDLFGIEPLKNNWGEIVSLPLEHQNKYKKFKEALETFLPSSIDHFLQLNPFFTDVGIELITTILLTRENFNSFSNSDTEKHSQQPEPLGNWYRILYEKITEGCNNSDDLEESLKNLTIITFNYDISLEVYLLDRLSKTEIFGENIHKSFDKLKVFHIYGKLYEINESKYNWTLYGKHNVGQLKDNFIKIAKLAAQKNIHTLRVFDKNFTLEKHILDARNQIIKSKKCFILGYGFDETNNNVLDLINTLRGNEYGKELFYTNYGRSQIIDNFIMNTFLFNDREEHYDGYFSQSNKLFIHKPSDKTVYKALLYDFNLT